MPPPIPFQPQFGVELEMVLKNVRRHFICSGTDEAKVFRAVAKRITDETGQAVYSDLEKNQPNQGDKPVVGGEHWTITQDASIREFSKASDKEQHSPKSKQDRTSLELVSPVIPWRPLGKSRLKRVVNFVRDTWNPSTNETTGLHVHIGNAAVPLGEIPFTLQQIMQLAKLCLLCEGAIDDFHPANRAGRGTNDNDYALSNVANPFFAQFRSMPERVRKVDEYVRGVRGIVDCMNVEPDVQGDTGSTKRYYKVNFASLEKHGSIEFRQHQGELGYDRIELWVAFLIAFVQAAIVMTNDEIERLAENPVTLDILMQDIVKDERYRKLIWKDYKVVPSVEGKIRVTSKKTQRKEKQMEARLQADLTNLQATEASGGTSGSQGAGPSTLESTAEPSPSQDISVENALDSEARGKDQISSKVYQISQSSQKTGTRRNDSESEPPASDDGYADNSSDAEDGSKKVRRTIWPSSGKEAARVKGTEDHDGDFFAM